jgi:DNA replication protein DnaC
MAPNGVVQHGETDKKAQKKTRGQLKRLKAKAKKAASGTESEATTDFETDSEREEADQAAAKIKEVSLALL